MIKISASIMCADLFNLAREIEILEKEKIDYLHLDVMDGHFVDNITLGIDSCIKIGAYSTPRDIHMLVDHPSHFLERFHLKPGELFQVHYECDDNIRDIANNVHAAGADFGLVLNPETSIENIRSYLDIVDVVTLMMIKPGFAGLPIEDGALDKIAYTKDWLNHYQAKDNSHRIIIEVDGHVDFETAPIMCHNGAQIFVAGTSSIFRKEMSLSDGINRMRNCLK